MSTLCYVGQSSPNLDVQILCRSSFSLKGHDITQGLPSPHPPPHLTPHPTHPFVWLGMTLYSSRGASRLRAWTGTWRNTTPPGCFIGARPKTWRRSCWWVLLPRGTCPWHRLSLSLTDALCHEAPSNVDRAVKHFIMRCQTCHLLWLKACL